MLTHAFEQPNWLWLLPAAVGTLLAVEWNARSRRINRAALLGVMPAHPSGWSLSLGLCAVACLIVAVAGLRSNSTTAITTAPGRDVAILLDVSRSMMARDVLPDRLGRARDLAVALIEDLARQGGQRVAVVAFAARSMLVVPLTYDLAFARTAVRSLDLAELADTRAAEGVSGTRIGDGLRQAVDALADGRMGARAVLLLSDGDDPARDGEWRRGIAGVPVFAVGIGDPENDSPVPGRPEASTRLQHGPLESLAAATDGRYFALGRSRVERLDWLVADLPAADDAEAAIGQAPPRRAPFIAAAIVLLSLTQLAPRRRWAAAVVAASAIAAGPVDGWLRRGDDALAAGQPERALTFYTRAAERTTDPGLVAFNQGVTLAQLGRHREAELHFRRSLSDAEGERRAKALFNLGTCLVKRSAGVDRTALRDAVASLQDAQRVASGELATEVNHNLTIANKLLAQLPADAKGGGETDSDLRRSESDKLGPIGAQDTGKSPTNGSSRPTDRSSVGKARPTDHLPPPGAGNVPPLADDDRLQPIAAQDLDVYLKQARERIAAAQIERWRARGTDKPPAYPDW